MVSVLFTESVKCRRLYPQLLRNTFSALDDWWNDIDPTFLGNDVTDPNEKCVLASVGYSLMNKADVQILRDKRAPVLKNVFV